MTQLERSSLSLLQQGLEGFLSFHLQVGLGFEGCYVRQFLETEDRGHSY